MREIGQWLEQNKERVLDIWEERVRQKLPVARPLDSPELTNSIPESYDDLVRTLMALKPDEYLNRIAMGLGKDHGEQRSRLRGYDLNHVIEEYQVLRHVLLEVARELGELHANDTDIILDAITIGIRNAASEFTKIRTEQLVRSKQEAEKANVAKSAFLANMSHEIRTPLGAILGYTELLKDSHSNSERNEFISVINRNGKLLSTLIDDILDLSKIEAGRLDLEYIDFQVHDLVTEVIGLFSERARVKGIRLSVDIDPSVPEIVTSDPTRIRQILINLVSNAIKFTSVGQVKVMIEARHAPKQALQVTVKDTGIGMNAEGTFKAIVEAKMSGNLIPTKISDKPYSGRTRVLLVEDSIDNQGYLKGLLEKKGIEVDLASDGREGVVMASSNHYDVIIMDVQMPILDGYGATRELREHGNSMPIMALTAHAFAEDRQKSLEAGCDAHLTKPVNPIILFQTIGKLRRVLH